MEYQYANDPITGHAKATFSLEHEILGPWLEVEVGNDNERLSNLLVAIDDVEHMRETEVVIIGCEYTANISREDVVIQANTSLNGAESPIPEELMDDVDNIDAGFAASCGTDDFRQILLSWAKFIKS